MWSLRTCRSHVRSQRRQSEGRLANSNSGLVLEEHDRPGLPALSELWGLSIGTIFPNALHFAMAMYARSLELSLGAMPLRVQGKRSFGRRNNTNGNSCYFIERIVPL